MLVGVRRAVPNNPAAIGGAQLANRRERRGAGKHLINRRGATSDVGRGVISVGGLGGGP